MPKLGLKFSKPHHFGNVSPNVACNNSLESYHLSPEVGKVSKNPKIGCDYNSLRRIAKTRFGSHCRLGVNQGFENIHDLNNVYVRRTEHLDIK